MGQWTPLIIALIYLAIHVISVLAKEAAKRKEREKARQEAERQRVTEARMEVPESPRAADLEPVLGRHEPQLATGGMGGGRGGGTAGSPWSPPTTVARPGKTLDDLAARRKEQLEQLRARRSGTATQAPGRPSTPTQSQRSIAAEQRRIAEAAREARQRLDRQAKLQKQREAAAEAQRESAARAARERTARTRSTGATEVAAASSPIEDPAHQQYRTQRVHALRQRLNDRHTLRDLMLLREIISPPVAMREPQPDPAA